MRRKVCILGGDFAAGFEEHAAPMKLADLPEFLGGTTPDAQCPLPEQAPRGARLALDKAAASEAASEAGAKPRAS